MTSPSSTVVTRFAPSPTGYLHIGGARTALFNWLYAKHHGGKFLIRIEDTDRERSTETAVKAIFDGLEWLSLLGDEETVYQYARADRHREVAQELLASGHAYRDFLTAEETGALRDQAKAEGKDFVSPWRDREPTTEDLQKPFTVRFRRPLDQAVVVDDAVQGTVRWESSSLDDLVILRSDGAPTYNLAVVVDDHDMGVTHVIRRRGATVSRPRKTCKSHSPCASVARWIRPLSSMMQCKVRCAGNRRLWTIWLSCAPTVLRLIIWPWWSMTTIWVSPTSSGVMTI